MAICRLSGLSTRNHNFPVFFILQRKKKEITWHVISQSPLFDIKNRITSGYYIIFNDLLIDDAFLSIIKITNTGNMPILPNDYIEKLGLRINENGSFIYSEVMETYPPTINASLNIEKNTINLEPVLLNPKDSLTIKLVTDLPYKNATIIGRIAGVKEIKQTQTKEFSTFSVGSFALFSLIFMAFPLLLCWLLYLFDDTPNELLLYLGISLLLVAYPFSKLLSKIDQRSDFFRK